MVRVSGTEGTAYQGSYGSTEGLQSAEDTVGAEPTDYQVDLRGASDVATATFAKTQSGDQTLRVQIVADGEVVADSQTTSDFGVVNVNWSPQQGGETTRGS